MKTKSRPTDGSALTSRIVFLWLVSVACCCSFDRVNAEQQAQAFAAATNGSTSVCSSAAFASLVARPLGSTPINIKSLIQGDQVCIHLSLPASKSSNAQWFSIGLGRRERMFSSPACTAFLLQKGDTVPINYKIKGYLASQTVKQQDQSVFTPFATTTNGGLVFSYQRSLAAMTADEVAIDPNVDAWWIWAYGDSWPITGHKAGTYGMDKYNFGTGTSPNADTGDSSFCDQMDCTAIFGGIAFVVMLIGGGIVLFTRKSKVSHMLLHRSLIQIPQKIISNAKVDMNPVHMFLKLLGDMFMGELLVVLVFMAAFIALAILCKNESNMTLTGRLSVLVLMFLFMPTSRVPWLWNKVFGSSFERVVKFHRWLGYFFMVIVIAHIAYVYRNGLNWLSAEKYNTAVPLWGTLSLISFSLLVLLSLDPVRRYAFEVFYYSHRIGLVASMVFAILHASYIGYAMIFSLAVYGISLLWRWYECTKYYQLQVTLKVMDSGPAGPGILTMALQPTKKTKELAVTMDPCSYFWVNIPEVCKLQWHPYSAITTPHNDSIGFVVKSTGPNSYTDKLWIYAKQHTQCRATLCGPFGQLALRIEDYDVLVLVAGGVGISPLLSLLNQHVYGDLVQNQLRKNQEILVVWTVRDLHELLMIDPFLPVNVDTRAGTIICGGGGDTNGIGNGPVLGSTGGCAKVHVLESKSPSGRSLRSLGPKVQWMRHVTSVTTADKPLMITRASGESLSYQGGRPALDQVINPTRFGFRKVGVLACGPATMVGETQRLARTCRFDFHKEVFTW